MLKLVEKLIRPEPRLWKKQKEEETISAFSLKVSDK